LQQVHCNKHTATSTLQQAHCNKHIAISTLQQAHCNKHIRVRLFRPKSECACDRRLQIVCRAQYISWRFLLPARHGF
jgi:hypothetical protein